MNHISAKMIVPGIIVLLIAGVVALELTNTTHFFHNSSKKVSGINYGPSTKSEKQDAESRKEAPVIPSSSSSPTTINNKKAVSVEITTFNPKTSDNNVSVNGFVSGVIESSGTCTLTLRDATGKQVTGTHPGEANATNTTCGETTIPLSSLHAGTWKAVLSYSSQGYAGTSDPVSIQVD